MRMSGLAEREWCAWTNGRASRDSPVAWRHDTLDGWLMVVAVEAAALDVWAQGTDVVPLFEVMVRRHGLISHSTRCWRL